MRMVSTLALILSIPAILNAQDWREELREDLVVHRDGKMIIEEYSIERVNLPGYEPLELQVKLYAEAPHDDTISRDNFVAMSAYLGITVLQTILAQSYDVSPAEFLAAYDTEDLVAPIGRPYLEISIFMTGEGFQLEIRNTLSNEVSRVTETWESALGSENY